MTNQTELTRLKAEMDAAYAAARAVADAAWEAARKSAWVAYETAWVAARAAEGEK